MNIQQEILNRFTGSGSGDPIFMPDLTLWYPWHKKRGTLPEGWQDHTLIQVAQALDAAVWVVERPWKSEMVGVDMITEEKENERVIKYKAPERTLFERWSKGSDGIWWQTEFPIKGPDDLPAARAIVEARTYKLDAGWLTATASKVGDAGVLALEIPMHPYADMMQTFLGWGEGLMLLFGKERDALLEMVAILEDKRKALVKEVAALPGTIVLAPDNLDGQYISPAHFKSHFTDSYRRTADVLHSIGKYLVVHVGGPGKLLLPLLADAGVDGIEGIAGPPQSDMTIKEAREAVGPGVTLWGGIPQDLLLKPYSEEQFETAVREAAQQAMGDGRVILGIADRVSVDSDFSRLSSTAHLIADCGKTRT